MRDKSESIKKRRIVGFCIKLIQERRKIKISELYEIAKAEFPKYNFTRRWLSRNIKKSLNGTGIVKWRPKNKELVFGLEEELLKSYKKCKWCGRLIPGNYPDWCSEKCYSELEKIAMWYSLPPKFPSLERAREILVGCESESLSHYHDMFSSQSRPKQVVVSKP